MLIPEGGKNSSSSNLVITCNAIKSMTLREKCPNTDFFLVRIFLYSVQIQENADQKKLRIWQLFTQCEVVISLAKLQINV